MNEIADRSLIIESIESWLRENGTFDAPFGILSSVSPDKRYRSVAFGRAAVLDAEIRVYGTSFITLRYRSADRTLPRTDHTVFRSLTELFSWMDENFNRKGEQNG